MEKIHGCLILKNNDCFTSYIKELDKIKYIFTEKDFFKEENPQKSLDNKFKLLNLLKKDWQDNFQTKSFKYAKTQELGFFSEIAPFMNFLVMIDFDKKNIFSILKNNNLNHLLLIKEDIEFFSDMYNDKKFKDNFSFFKIDNQNFFIPKNYNTYFLDPCVENLEKLKNMIEKNYIFNEKEKQMWKDFSLSLKENFKERKNNL